MNPIIVPATDAHAVAMAPRMRLNDALEVRRAGVIYPIEALRGSMAMSLHSWTWLYEGRPGCMFGLAGNLISDETMPWLLTTDDVQRHPITFWRHSKRIVELMRETTPVLAGYCDSRYAATVRWLTRLGFVLEGPIPFGPLQLPFYKFRMA